MTLSSTHARERSVRRRRTSRAVARVALVVLLGQVILPHLHALQTGAHAATTDARAHRAAARLHDAPVAIECAASPAEREHSESRCPVCQTLAHAHDFLPTTSRHPALAEAVLVGGPPPHDARRVERVTARAPRSPPLAA